MSEVLSQSSKRKPGRPSGGKARAREDIKRAALGEFARCGFQATRLEQVAKVAGVAKPLIHYHFGSKADLWAAAVSEEFDDFQAEVATFEAELKRVPQAEFVELFAQRSVRFAATHCALIQISLDETRQGGERAAWLLKSYYVPIGHAMTSIFATMLEGEDAARFASHVLPSLFGAIALPFLDAEVVAETHCRDVFSEDYIVGQSEYIAMLLRASITESQRRIS